MAKIIEFPKERVGKKSGDARLKIEATAVLAEEVDKEEASARMGRIMQSLQNINRLMAELRRNKDETSK